MVTRRVLNLFSKKQTRQTVTATKLNDLAETLRTAAEAADPEFAKVFWKMAGHLQRISTEVAVDHEDFLALRHFASHHASKITDLALKLAELQERNAMASEFSGRDILAKFKTYCDLFRRAEAACVSNDIDSMKREMEALDIQLARLNL